MPTMHRPAILPSSHALGHRVNFPLRRRCYPTPRTRPLPDLATSPTTPWTPDDSVDRFRDLCPSIREPRRRQVARKIDFNDPQVLLYVRVFYVAVQVIVLGIYYYATLKVRPKSAREARHLSSLAELTLPLAAQIKQKNDLKVLKYTEPAKPMSGEGPTQVTTTNRDYDLAETSKAIRGVLMGVLFVRPCRL